jgi:hypothetical protein
MSACSDTGKTSTLTIQNNESVTIYVRIQRIRMMQIQDQAFKQLIQQEWALIIMHIGDIKFHM